MSRCSKRLVNITYRRCTDLFSIFQSKYELTYRYRLPTPLKIRETQQEMYPVFGSHFGFVYIPRTVEYTKYYDEYTSTIFSSSDEEVEKFIDEKNKWCYDCGSMDKCKEK